MSQIKILLAGPGTGKTTKVKEILKSHPDTKKALVLSFTNATINDLLTDFSKDKIDITSKNCMTLHKYAMKINHLTSKHILNTVEIQRLNFYAEKLGVSFSDLCDMLDCMTYQDMIVKCTQFVKSNPLYAKNNIGEIELLIIDEYQDFNSEEREFINLIIENSKETIILGDDDQCIYAFKNAASDGIISLYNDSNILKIDHANICHRCPNCVVEAGNKLIKNNKNRIDKDWHQAGKDGELQIKQTMTETETNKYLVDEIKQIKAQFPDDTIMVLSPMSFGVKSFIDTLDQESIPNVNWWEGKIELEKLIKIWTLRFVFGPMKLLNIMLIAFDYPKRQNKNWKQFMELLKQRFIHNKSTEETIQEIEKLNVVDPLLIQQAAQGVDYNQFFMQHSDYSEYKIHLDDEQKRERNLEKLEVLLKQPLEFDKSKVNIMSIHKSKGLQADHVFITSLVNGILPKDSQAVDSIEAERRLLFVAMSRVRKKLHMISMILWEGNHVHRANKDKFIYDYKTKKYKAQASSFINEVTESASVRA